MVNDVPCSSIPKRGVNLTPQERKTALLFQNYMLFPNLTVEENVARRHRQGRAEGRARAPSSKGSCGGSA